MPENPSPDVSAPAGRVETLWRRLRAADPFRWVIEHPATVDAVVFGAIALLVLLMTAATGFWDWWVLFTVPMLLAGALGRIRPSWCLALIATLAVVHLLLDIPIVLGDVMTYYAMFCGIAYGRVATSRIAVGLGLLGTVSQSVYWGVIDLWRSPYGGVAESFAITASMIVVGTISIIAVWALARLQNARLTKLRLTQERAEQAIREREQRTALAVAEERARIAREMHDVVAHSLSVIIAQADGGRFIASQKPEQAAEVLGTISETGRAALADMRSLLGVLRADEETSFGPQPDLQMLPELLRRVRGAGLPVDVVGEIDASRIPQATSLSIFRLIQEALTNVLKHAGPEASAEIRLHQAEHELEIEILDDGQGIDPDSDGQGRGLTGMRERVAVLGGSLQAGPLTGRGFRVHAVVPLPMQTTPSPVPRGEDR